MEELLMLNPNCSEITVTLNVDKLDENQRREIVKEFRKLEDYGETSIEKDKMFGHEIVRIDGQGPYYEYEAYENIWKRYNLEGDDIHVSEPR